MTAQMKAQMKRAQIRKLERQADADAIQAEVRANDVAQGGRACRGCGCTDNSACIPLCWWVERDLCSSCEAAIAP